MSKIEFEFDKYIAVEDIKEEASNHTNNNTNSSTEQKENPIPVEALPLAMQQIVSGLYESLNFPKDFTVSAMIFASAVATGNTHRIKVTEGWEEPPIFYFSLVGPPGTTKSHPLSYTTQPILTRDKQTYREFKEQDLEFTKNSKLTKKERDQLGIVELEKPFWRKYICSDITPEALAQTHEQNKRSIGIVTDEQMAWLNNLNRYNKGSEMEMWLSMFSAKPITIDRKLSGPIFIPYPFVPVIGTLQTGMLEKMAEDGRTQNGFIDRILFAIPDNLKKPYWSEKELDPNLTESWYNIIFNLLDMPFNVDENLCPKPEILRFSPDAWKKLKEWQRENADLTNEAQNEQIAGIYSKLEIYAIRLALILELLYWACNESDKQHVSLKAVKSALQLIEYFRATAVKVQAIVSKDDPLIRLSKDKREVYEALPASFTTEEGLKIAGKFKFPERTFKEFIKNKEFFEKVKHGQYNKIHS